MTMNFTGFPDEDGKITTPYPRYTKKDLKTDTQQSCLSSSSPRLRGASVTHQSQLPACRHSGIQTAGWLRFPNSPPKFAPSKFEVHIAFSAGNTLETLQWQERKIIQTEFLEHCPQERFLTRRYFYCTIETLLLEFREQKA